MSRPNAEVQSIACSLGYVNEAGDGYDCEPDCLELVKDLIRHVRHDRASSCSIRRCMLATGVLHNDLLAILKWHRHQTELWDFTLRLMLNLTQAPHLSFEQSHASLDQFTQPLFQELVTHLADVKGAFVDATFMEMCAELLSKHLNTDWREREEDSSSTIIRLLLLLRNVLSIPAASSADRQSHSATHARLVSAVFESSLADVMLSATASTTNAELHIHIAELLVLCCEGQEMKDVARALAKTRTKDMRREQSDALKQTLARATAASALRASLIKQRPTTFAGDYIVGGRRTIGAESKADVATNRVVTPNNDAPLPWIEERKKRKVARNRRAVIAAVPTKAIIVDAHDGTKHVQRRIAEFLQTLVEKHFKVFARSLKKSVDSASASVSQSGTSHSDVECTYATFIAIVLQFRRHAAMGMGATGKNVLPTLSLTTFHWLNTQLDNYLEMALTDKAANKEWGARAAVLMRLFNEMMLSLQDMGADADASVRRSAEDLKQRLFYEAEYRENCVNLLRRYNHIYLSRAYLTDLVSASHVHLRLLGRSCDQGKIAAVQERRKAKRAKKGAKEKVRPTPNSATAVHVEPPPSVIETQWTSMSRELIEVVNADDEPLPDVSPIDMLLVDTIDEEKQRQIAMLNIQMELRAVKSGTTEPDDVAHNSSVIRTAVALYRASRQMWPNDDIFGASDISPTMEALELRDIHTADLSEVHDMRRRLTPAGINEDDDEMPRSSTPATEQGGDLFDHHGRSSEAEMNSEEEAESYVMRESSFNFEEHVAAFYRYDVLRCYIELFETFERNSTTTNSHVVRMLHRVATNEAVCPLLYNAHLMRLLQRLNAPLNRLNTSLAELRQFAKFLIKKFIADVKREPLTALEMLAPMSKNEAYDVRHGLKEAAKIVWTEELEQEVRQLHDEHAGMSAELASVDVADYIGSNLSVDRNRRQIVKCLRHLGLVTKDAVKIGNKLSAKEIARKMLWPDWLVGELRTQFRIYTGFATMERDSLRDKDAFDYCISHMSSGRSRKQVINQLKRMENIEVTPWLTKNLKGRAKKKSEAKSQGQSFLEANGASSGSDVSDGSDSDDDLVMKRRSPAPMQSVNESLSPASAPPGSSDDKSPSSSKARSISPSVESTATPAKTTASSATPSPDSSPMRGIDKVASEEDSTESVATLSKEITDESAAKNDVPVEKRRRVVVDGDSSDDEGGKENDVGVEGVAEKSIDDKMKRRAIIDDDSD